MRTGTTGVVGTGNTVGTVFVRIRKNFEIHVLKGDPDPEGSSKFNRDPDCHSVFTALRRISMIILKEISFTVRHQN